MYGTFLSPFLNMTSLTSETLFGSLKGEESREKISEIFNIFLMNNLIDNDKWTFIINIFLI